MKVSETDDKDIFMHLCPCIEDDERYSENWYRWNCENWGTKWDANEVVMGSCDGEYIELHFDTVWSTPIVLYTYLVENGWDVKAYYYEEGIELMSLELMDFTSPLYDFFESEEEEEGC